MSSKPARSKPKGRAARNRSKKSAQQSAPPETSAVLTLSTVFKQRRALHEGSVPSIVGLSQTEQEQRQQELAETDGAVAKALGYVPGNALRVTRWDSDDENDDTAHTLSEEKPNSPTVLLLYPLCCRPTLVKKKKTGKKVALSAADVGLPSSAPGSEPKDYAYNSRKRRRHGSQTSPARNWSVSLEGGLYGTAPRGTETGYVVEPMPTVFWLTSPRWKRLTSVVEDKHNGVKVLQARLASSPSLDTMAAAHAGYAAHSRGSLHPEDRSYYEAHHPSWFPEGRGVGGLKVEGGGLRCLHMHLAHWMGGKGMGGEFNVVGKWVEEWCRQIEKEEQEELEAATKGG